MLAGGRPYNPRAFAAGPTFGLRAKKSEATCRSVQVATSGFFVAYGTDWLMTVASDPQVRKLAGRILLWQALVTVGLGALVGTVAGRGSGLSAVTGGVIGLIANLYMTLAALRPVRNAGHAFGRLMVGQVVKVALTVGMFLAVAQREDVVWPAVFAGYVATLVVFWAVPALAAPTLPPRSRARE